MHMKLNVSHHHGFIQIILIIVIGLIILGVFSINVGDILASPIVQDNLSYAWNLVKDVWGTYLSGPAAWLWDKLGSVLWGFFLDGLDNLESNGGQLPVSEISIQ